MHIEVCPLIIEMQNNNLEISYIYKDLLRACVMRLFLKPKNIMNLESFTKRIKTNKASNVVNEIDDYNCGSFHS